MDIQPQFAFILTSMPALVGNIVDSAHIRPRHLCALGFLNGLTCILKGLPLASEHQLAYHLRYSVSFWGQRV
jgi:hypothetical protein